MLGIPLRFLNTRVQLVLQLLPSFREILRGWLQGKKVAAPSTPCDHIQGQVECGLLRPSSSENEPMPGSIQAARESSQAVNPVSVQAMGTGTQR